MAPIYVRMATKEKNSSEESNSTKRIKAWNLESNNSFMINCSIIAPVAAAVLVPAPAPASFSCTFHSYARLASRAEIR